jgi:hypothetical protein
MLVLASRVSVRAFQEPETKLSPQPLLLATLDGTGLVSIRGVNGRFGPNNATRQIAAIVCPQLAISRRPSPSPQLRAVEASEGAGGGPVAGRSIFGSTGVTANEDPEIAKIPSCGHAVAVPCQQPVTAGLANA